jgi:hypothetical protein
MVLPFVTIRAPILEAHERAVVVSHGLPARPVIIPLANVDFEPVGFSPICDAATVYEFTMSREVAKDIGLIV